VSTDVTSDIFASSDTDSGGFLPAVHQIRGILKTIWERRWSALTFLLIVMTIVSVATFSQEPVYKATTLLRISKDDLKVLSFTEFVAADESTDELIKTEVEVIRSRGLAEAVASALNLPADTDFQKELRPGGVAQLIAHLKGSPEASGADEADKRLKDAVVVRLLRMIDIEPIRGSRLVKFSVFARSKKLAAEIANTWADLYIKQGIDQKMAASKDASQMLFKQIEKQRRYVEEAEKKLHVVARRYGIYSYEDMKTNINQRLSELNTLLTEAQANRIEKKVAYKSMQSDPLGSEVSVNDPVVQRLREDIAKLEGEYSDFLKTFKPDYPECVRLRARIAQISQAINEQTHKWLQAAATDYAAAEQRAVAIKKELEQQQNEAMRLQDVAVEYNSLNRDMETSTEHYRALLARRKEALSAMQIKASNVSVVDMAKLPSCPHSPRRALNLILALVMGTALACAMCVLLDYMDNSVRTSEDVEKDIGETLLGIVPQIEEDDESGSENKDLISHLDGKSAISEAYRTIRTSLSFAYKNNNIKNIVISSAVPGEGKTITAINIATVLGQIGEKVLLIDADMRRPRLHRSLHLPNSRGLSTFLVEQSQLNDIILPTCLPNVDVIVSGPAPPNPSELLGSERMTDLLALCKDKYDRVIIDTPPVMAVTDSRLTAARADGLIHVIRAGKTEKRCAKEAKKHFDTVGARVIGAVLNDVEEHAGGYNHYYYYRPYTN